MSKEKQRQLDEINRPRNDELYNNIEKQYQELAKVKTDSEQIEEMARVYDKARLKARDTLGSMNEGEEMWYSKAFYEAGYRKQSENVIELPCKVGTTLYFLYNNPYADKPDLTPRIYKTSDWYFEVDKTGIVINTSDIHSFNKKYDYYLGETVFLTREEAEAKMKGGE